MTRWIYASINATLSPCSKSVASVLQCCQSISIHRGRCYAKQESEKETPRNIFWARQTFYIHFTSNLSTLPCTHTWPDVCYPCALWRFDWSRISEKICSLASDDLFNLLMVLFDIYKRNNTENDLCVVEQWELFTNDFSIAICNLNIYSNWYLFCRLK